MDKSYRIKTNIGAGVEKMINVNLKQDVDLYEILSLKLSQEKLYEAHSANYGVIVGRVLANDAFGVPNARVSVFIPLSDDDAERTGISSIYPFNAVTDYDSNNIRYNLLSSKKEFPCHANVGTFPSKRLVLDDDTMLEIYDKYYRYTTVTNKAGDYMIFGVPVGQQVLHVDVDLSDIGLLSQTPRDMVYKGYPIDMFESPVKFKKSTNLADLVQIHSENVAVEVYPFWGDETVREVAITRKDINLQYKFEPTCVFLGSILTDNGMNAIGHNCVPDEKMGEASQLTTTEGTIEMIRKTIDGKVEEFPIKGNNLIDGNGIFCYQIPMNLDYVGMDEYGNIVPTNNPLKGIPTRSRVRFRFTLKESGEGDMTTHTARYLIPNNPPLYEDLLKPKVETQYINTDIMYEFGTLTPENCFRDLYWNKVYSVKGYLPRLQTSAYEKTSEYLALKGVNKREAQNNNVIPFNKINLNFKIATQYLLQHIYGKAGSIWGVSNYSLFKRMWWLISPKSIPFNIDSILESIIDETDAVSLDFYNDWLNGCLYFPAWHWRSRKKTSYSEGDEVYESLMCECREKADEGGGKLNNALEKLYVLNNCSLIYDTDDLQYTKDLDIEKIENPGTISDYKAYNKTYFDSYFAGTYHAMTFGSKSFISGIVKKVINKDGGELYYYSFGNNLTEDVQTVEGYDLFDYARLFSTDIILLGSLNDCDIDGVPKMPYTYPATTATIPPVGRIKHDISEGTEYDSDDDMEENLYHQNGMNWGRYWQNYVLKNNPVENDSYDFPNKQDILHTGLFFGLRRHITHHGWWFTRHIETDDFIAYSDPKTCINVERLCELGVINDKYVVQKVRNNDGSQGDGIVEYTTGMILKKCLIDNNARALFATLNSGKLVAEKENKTTGYKTYNLVYFYPTNFDGRLEALTHKYLYPRNQKHDLINKDYIDFRLGNSEAYSKRTKRSGFGAGRTQGRTSSTDVYSNSNGLWGGSRNGVSTIATDNNEVELSYLNSERKSHFYGVNIKSKGDMTGDSTFPLKQSSFLAKLLSVGYGPTQFEYAFPLYDNSFYFYFGLVRGNTAIDKFYSEFYGECPDNVKNGFATQVTGIEPAGTCEVNNGKIYYTIEEAEFPCTTELYMHGQLIYSENGISKTENEITGLTNDVYVLKITDNTGAYTEETFTINPNKILLVWSVKNQIRTEYTSDKSCADICGNNYYAELLFDKVTIEGIEHAITGLAKVENSGELAKVGVYDLVLTPDSKKARLKITPRGIADNTAFETLLCGTCNPPDSIIGNVMNFNQPVLLDVEVVQLCVSEEGTTESPNSDFYTISITDLKLPELFINDVPYKFMVGTKEDLLDTYNVKFHTGQPVESVTDTMISGWFGVHIPDTYTNLFKNPTTDLSTWYKHTSEDSISEILNQKFTYMFNLSKGAYIIADEKDHTFNVRIAGGSDTQLLLRSGFPKYADFLENNTEQLNQFTSFLTSSAGDITAHTASPNIVAENYRYVDASTKYPIDKNLIPNGPEPVITVKPYDFNPKYSAYTNSAGNYFAGFTKNAGLLETSNDCLIGDDGFKSIPAKAHDLYRKDISGTEVHMCPNAERSKLEQAIYTITPPPIRQINGHDDTAYTYTRTEFIDRRFDFDMFYITPYNKKVEEEWSMGRLSALTYNGIEMLYDNAKNIIGNGCEYAYDINSGVITYNYNGSKRFYESILEYGSGKEIDLRSAYKYLRRPSPTADIVQFIPSDSYLDPLVSNSDNFGLLGTTVTGYPSRRSLNFYNIPYGDYYKFKNVSCSYDISLDHREQSFAALASPGEVVSYTIETKSPVQLQVNDFERDYSTSNYNILYNWCIGNPCSRSQFTITAQEGSMRMNCSATSIKEIIFKIISTGTTNFASKIEDNIDENKFGVRLVGDDIVHTNMKGIKKASSLDDVKTIVTTNTIENSTIALPPGNWLDTDSSFIDYSFSATNRTIQNGYKYIYILADRFYYSKYADSLLKKIRVLNASTMYDIGNFSLIYSGHKYVSKDLITIIPGENIKVNVEAEGDVPVPTPEGGEGGGGEQGGGGAGGTTNVPVGVSGTGEGSQDASGNAKDMHDLLFFTIDGGNSETSGINVNDIDDFCFKVTEPNQLTYYKRYDTDNEISGNTIVIKLPLRKNDNLIKCFGGLDNDGNCLPADAAIQLFIKMKNQLVYYLDFKLKGEMIAATQTDPEKLKVTISPYTKNA